jgi:hypothetical protein
MKKRFFAFACVAIVGLLPVVSARATLSTTDVAADALVVRPVSFVGTILGSVAFVVTLPFTVPCGGVHQAAKSLVGIPAYYTFKRPLGELDSSLGD